ncbi:MAG: adenosylcobalamin-dependent ribonucleoside-diphosphate reductase [Candidatus Hydrogenedentales bacterium]
MLATLSIDALRILEARYLRRDSDGELVETPTEMFRRVSNAIAAAETAYDGESRARQWAAVFFESLSKLEFLPNSPVLMNAGLPAGQMAACFVLPVEDNLAAIFDTLRLMALVQQSGGGTGFSFSSLRPKGDPVTMGGTASGPVSFMRVFDCATEHVRLGGRRRGANMGVLSCQHPDILEFIEAKTAQDRFCNFNLSVALTDEFMYKLDAGQDYALINPRTRQKTGRLAATEVFERIAHAAWTAGDPGVLFLDAINRANPTPKVGSIEATNPCGEVPLLPYEACVLGSINLAKMVRKIGSGYEIDWDRLGATVRLGVRFLDNAINVGRWPDYRISRAARANRKIGLGVMGWAELLIMLDIPYGSRACLALADQLMRAINEEARRTSETLARERGPFPNWSSSIYATAAPVRNATRTAIAPTGTLSIIAGTSASIEPLFALAYRRKVLDGETMSVPNPLASRYGLMASSRTNGNSCELKMPLLADEIEPDHPRESLRTALDLAPEEHLAVQAAFQRHVDNAVSKTINLPKEATPESVAAIYRNAWEHGLKGVTIYRYGSKGQQVFELEEDAAPIEREHAAQCDPEACRM